MLVPCAFDGILALDLFPLVHFSPPGFGLLHVGHSGLQAVHILILTYTRTRSFRLQYQDTLRP